MLRFVNTSAIRKTGFGLICDIVLAAQCWSWVKKNGKPRLAVQWPAREVLQPVTSLIALAAAVVARFNGIIFDLVIDLNTALPLGVRLTVPFLSPP